MRDIPSAENLTAEVDGDIEEVDGVMKITAIRLHFRVRIPTGSREKANRALETYAEKCPAHQSVKGCIACSWDADFQEQ